MKNSFKSMATRFFSTILALCMLVSVFFISDDYINQEVEAASYGLAQNVQDGQILQCWNWSFTNIKNNMAKIAEQGFSAVQTSPIQGSKESTKEYYSTMSNSWWVYYQPINFNIETNSYNALGTSAEFKAMCDEAEKYGIKVIVDAVLNHTANNNGNNSISTLVPADLRNDTSCWHDITRNSWYESRWDITQFCMEGIPDLNTGNAKVQQYAIDFLKECIDAGADGFRFDGAKHIEVPTDYDYASDFWPNVLGAATSYAQSTKGFTPYYYGEILDGPSGSSDRSNAQTTLNSYMNYMSVTQSSVSNSIRNAVAGGNASGASRTDFYFDDGSQAKGTKSVLWNESHDTYIHGGSGGISVANMNKTWAIVGSRKEAAGMYMARPSSNSDMLGSAGITGWANAEVKAVNQFKNKFIGQDEYISTSGSIVINERGTSGAVLVNVGGNSTSVNVRANKLANGTYKDAITGNTFTVSGGYIKGNIGSTGIAVITSGNTAETPTLPTGKATIYFDDSSYKWGTVYAYVYADSCENAAWPGVLMTLDSSTGYYKMDLDGVLPYGKVIFTKSANATVNRYAADGADGLSINGTNMIFTANNAWNKYVPQDSTSGKEYVINTSTKKVHLPTCRYATSASTSKYYGSLQALLDEGYTACGTCKPSEDNSSGGSTVTPTLPTGKATIYFDDSSYKWGTVYAYVYADSCENAAWPGVRMTLDSSTGYYKMDLDGALAYGKVIFTKSANATVNRYPADGAEGLSINGTNMIFTANNAWNKYVPQGSDSGKEYVINTSTKKVHLPTCRYASSASTSTYYGDIQTLLNEGYTACGTCKPAGDNSSGDSSDDSSSGNGSAENVQITLNTKTKKIHLSECRYAKNASSSNLKSYSGDVYALIEQGYKFCATCKPNKVITSSGSSSSDSSETNPLIPMNSNYTVDGKLIFGVREKTTASTLLKSFASSDLIVCNEEGTKVNGNKYVGTGYCIRYMKDGKIVDYLEIIVFGDVDGSGRIDSTDYLRIKNQWMNKITTTDVYEIAADVDRSGRIDSTDYLRIKGHFDGTYDLYA